MEPQLITKWCPESVPRTVIFLEFATTLKPYSTFCVFKLITQMVICILRWLYFVNRATRIFPKRLNEIKLFIYPWLYLATFDIALFTISSSKKCIKFMQKRKSSFRCSKTTILVLFADYLILPCWGFAACSPPGGRQAHDQTN